MVAFGAFANTPAAGARRNSAPHVTLPASIRAGRRVDIRGSGDGGASPIALQKQVGKHWITLVRGIALGGHFHLVWRAPKDPAVLLLRVAVLRGRTVLSATPGHRLDVRAPVRVLPGGKVTSVPRPGASGEVRVAGHVAVDRGDVIATGISAETPDGFLGEVTSVRYAVGATILNTKPTSLLAVVPEGSIKAAVDSANGLASTSSAGGGAHARTAGGGLRESLAKDFACSGGVSGRLGGSVSLTTSASFQAHWSLFHGVDKASFTGTANASAELGASVDASASCTLSKTGLLPRPWTLTPIVVQVGPIPVVLVPQVQVYVSASGKVDAGVKTGVHGSLSATAGLSYESGHVHPIATQNTNFGFEPPTVTGSASLSGRVTPTLDLLLYGVAGPEVSFSAGLELTANLASEPWWTLGAPVDLDASLTVPALGLGTGELNVYHHVFPIAQAPPRSSQPQPQPQQPLAQSPTSSAGKRTIAYYDSSEDLGCTLLTFEDTDDEFYTRPESPNDACGTFLAVEGELFGPASIPAGDELGFYEPWTPVEQRFNGEGTAEHPYEQVTVVEAAGTGVQLTETDRWEDGGSSVLSDYAISGAKGDHRAVRLYRAADCYVGNSDFGYGTYDSASQAVGCLRTDPDGSEFQEQLRPLSPAGAGSVEAFFNDIWGDVATQGPLPETCSCGEELDDGVATSWELPLHGTTPVTASSQFAFVPAP